MMEDLPLLTMTKSRIVGEQPKLSDASTALLDTLSTLCSFHSCEDLASFLFTDMFRDLVGEGEPWIIFEIGVYKDHTKTIELIPVHDGITLADGAMTGGITDNITVVKSQAECSEILSFWLNYVTNE
tara:strand:+ start:1868 stop:2248 length:381 start_codon:yes stop_codon:yes gene_type:complete